MKKLFLNLFVFGALSFGLQSCGEDNPCDDVTCAVGQVCDDGNCVEDPNANCDFCGTYQGTLTGNVSVQDTAELGTSNYLIDSTFTSSQPLTSSSKITKSGNDYTLEIDLTSLGIAGLKPKVTGVYNAATKTIQFTDANYSYNLGGNVNLDFVINGTANFSTANTINADVVLASPSGSVAVSSGNLIIVGTK